MRARERVLLVTACARVAYPTASVQTHSCVNVRAAPLRAPAWARPRTSARASTCASVLDPTGSCASVPVSIAHAQMAHSLRAPRRHTNIHAKARSRARCADACA
eukprot:6199154-Pleurochrysis_carterae.AAC.2